MGYLRTPLNAGLWSLEMPELKRRPSDYSSFTHSLIYCILETSHLRFLPMVVYPLMSQFPVDSAGSRWM